MYRPTSNPRERAVSIAVVAAIHLGLAYAFLHAGGRLDFIQKQDELEVFDVNELPLPPPPPPVVEKIPEPQQEKPKKEVGAASAKNIESRATPVVAPKPRIALPVPVPMPVTETPNTGNEATQGASDVVGPGTGAGGVGTGTGSGGSGSGTGGGGGGGEGTRPRLVTRPLTERDYPRALREQWPAGARVMVAVRVQLDGRATDCKINRSSGVPAIDQITCTMVQSKLRFRPATDDRGRPYVAWYGYMQYPVNF